MHFQVKKKCWVKLRFIDTYCRQSSSSADCWRCSSRARSPSRYHTFFEDLGFGSLKFLGILFSNKTHTHTHTCAFPFSSTCRFLFGWDQSCRMLVSLAFVVCCYFRLFHCTTAILFCRCSVPASQMFWFLHNALLAKRPQIAPKKKQQQKSQENFPLSRSFHRFFLMKSDLAALDDDVDGETATAVFKKGDIFSPQNQNENQQNIAFRCLERSAAPLFMSLNLRSPFSKVFSIVAIFHWFRNFHLKSFKITFSNKKKNLEIFLQVQKSTPTKHDD